MMINLNSKRVAADESQDWLKLFMAMHILLVDRFFFCCFKETKSNVNLVAISVHEDDLLYIYTWRIFHDRMANFKSDLYI